LRVSKDEVVHPDGSKRRKCANASGKILRHHLRDPYWTGRERQVN
jgi:hypothetical protein